MTTVDRVQVCTLAYIVWDVLAKEYRFSAANPIEALSSNTQAPWHVSTARIRAARENASDAQLFALSIWQTTARAASAKADPELLASAAAIWNTLRSTAHDVEPVLAEDARRLANACFKALTDTYQEV